MSPRILRTASAAAALIGASFAVQAQGSIPAMKSEGALQYACGGIGSDESTAMRAAMKQHPLALLFSAKDGAYLANMQVQIKAEGGSGDSTFTASGPVCLLQLPEGRYNVTATTQNGATQSKSVTVGKGSQTLDFRY